MYRHPRQGEHVQHSAEDLRAFIGPKADYYLQSWSTIDPDGGLQPSEWNWAAFFLNMTWLLYLRMYRYFWICFGGLFLIGVLQIMLYLRGGAVTPWLGTMLNIGFYVGLGVYGNWMYYRHANRTISQLKADHAGPDAIAEAGGVSLLSILLLFVIPVILGILALIIIPQMAKNSPGVPV